MNSTDTKRQNAEVAENAESPTHANSAIPALSAFLSKPRWTHLTAARQQRNQPDKEDRRDNPDPQRHGFTGIVIGIRHLVLVFLERVDRSARARRAVQYNLDRHFADCLREYLLFRRRANRRDTEPVWTRAIRVR